MKDNRYKFLKNYNWNKLLKKSKNNTGSVNKDESHSWEKDMTIDTKKTDKTKDDKSIDKNIENELEDVLKWISDSLNDSWLKN